MPYGFRRAFTPTCSITLGQDCLFVCCTNACSNIVLMMADEKSISEILWSVSL